METTQQQKTRTEREDRGLTVAPHVHARIVLDGPERVEAFAVELANACLLASPDGARPILASVMLEREGAALRIVATDSYALSVVTVEADFHEEPFGSVLIPRASALDIVKALKPVNRHGRHPVVALELDLNHADSNGGRWTFTVPTAGITLSGLTVEGEFPNWEQLIPKNAPAGKGEPIGIASFQLARLGKVRTPGGDKNPSIVVTPGETSLKPFTFTVRGSNLSGLVMPVRLN